MPWDRHSHTRSVPYRLQQQCFQRDKWICQGCGYEGRQRKGDLHADHIVSRAQGGQDELGNLQTLCHDRCHRTKTQREAQAGRQRGKRPPPPHPADQ